MIGLPDIPKIYVAIAEWMACIGTIALLKKRFSMVKTGSVLLLLLPLLCILQWQIGIGQKAFFIPRMIIVMLLMYLCIHFCCSKSWWDTGFYWACSFILAELIASLEWQIGAFLMRKGYIQVWFQNLLMIVFYSLMFLVAYFVEKKYFQSSDHLGLTRKEVISSIVLVLSVFLISNISYAYPDTPFSISMNEGVFYIRTLVDFSGVIIIFSQLDRFQELQLKKELEATNNILRRQYEIYQQSKENIDIINRKYHDLKHQIAVIRKESDTKKRDSYLEEMEIGLKLYEAQYNTGNTVLDTILTGKNIYCVQHDINFTCVVDGSQLNFMNTMDICTIFGNALDNAIESVEQLEGVSKRLIRVAVYSQNELLMIRFENYFESPLKIDEEGFVTTKKNKEYHGYGIKSIRYTAEKYGGSITIHSENNWFKLRVLIPITR